MCAVTSVCFSNLSVHWIEWKLSFMRIARHTWYLSSLWNCLDMQWHAGTRIISSRHLHQHHWKAAGKIQSAQRDWIKVLFVMQTASHVCASAAQFIIFLMLKDNTYSSKKLAGFYRRFKTTTITRYSAIFHICGQTCLASKWWYWRTFSKICELQCKFLHWQLEK